MRTYLPHLVCVIALVGLTLALRVVLRVFLTTWWRKPLVLAALRWVPRFGLACTAVWMLGTLYQNYALIVGGASLVVVVLITAGMSLVSLPIAIGLHALHARRADKLNTALLRPRPVANSPAPPAISRREFLRSSAAAMPLLATASGLSGVVKSFDEVRLPVLHFKFAELPAALHGLKISQLSDMHLGYFRGVQDMEKLFERVAAQQPDLVCVTGDIADDLSLLPAALRLLEALAPPFGVYASLGNHEYYRGVKNVRKVFETSTIPLLCNAGLVVPVKGTSLFIGGADDPSRSHRTDFKTFFPKTAEAALRDAPSAAFKILMTHRPQGFHPAAEFGVQLALAGHTHGMQIGYNGRSLFEMNGREKLLWGHYRRDAAQLYTTSGVGHWFPFRLGCPPEAPLIVLEKVL